MRNSSQNTDSAPADSEFKAYFRRALNLDCQAIRVAQSNRESLTGLGPRLKGSAELFEKKMPCNFNRLLKVVTIFPLARRT